MKHIKKGAVSYLGNVFEDKSYNPDDTGGEDGEVNPRKGGVGRQVLDDGRATEIVSHGASGEEGHLSLVHLESMWRARDHHEVVGQVHQVVADSCGQGS